VCWCAPPGTLPPSWGALKKLRALNLAFNRLKGSLPAAWVGMSALERLDMGGNTDLTGVCVGGGGVQGRGRRVWVGVQGRDGAQLAAIVFVCCHLLPHR
jgi:hypothetical protein